MSLHLHKNTKLFWLSALGVLFSIIGIISLLLFNNPLIPILVLNTYLVIFFILQDIFRTKAILTYGVLFNIIWWMYTNIYVIESLIDNIAFSRNDYTLSVLSVVSMLSFNLVFYFRKETKVIKKDLQENIANKYSFKKLKYIILVTFIAALLIQLYVIGYKIGFSNYTFSTRAARSVLIRPYRPLMIYESLIIWIAVISYYIKTIHKSKLNNLIFYSALIIALFNSLTTISRTDFLMLILPILFIGSYQKRISNKTIILLLTSILLLFVIWKGLLSGLIFNQEFQVNSTNSTAEFTEWYVTGNNILNDYFSGELDYLYGKSFFETTLNLIIPFTHVEPLSVWYVKNYEYSTYLAGGGRGFSGVIEGFMNLPFVGNILYFMFLGFLFKKIEKLRYLDAKYLIIYSVSLPYILRIFRSESYSLFKTWFWFYVLTTLIVFYLSKSKKINNKQPKLKVR